MSYLPGYTPKVPDLETVKKLSRDMTGNIFAEFFKDSMPQMHDAINKTLGTMSMSVRDTDRELAEEIDRISVGNADASKIFIDFILPEYEKIINFPEEDMEEDFVKSDSGSTDEGTEELVQGNEGIN